MFICLHIHCGYKVITKTVQPAKSKILTTQPFKKKNFDPTCRQKTLCTPYWWVLGVQRTQKPRNHINYIIKFHHITYLQFARNTLRINIYCNFSSHLVSELVSPTLWVRNRGSVRRQRRQTWNSSEVLGFHLQGSFHYTQDALISTR